MSVSNFHGTALYPALMLAARITLAHLSVSSARSLPKSADAIDTATLPRSARCDLNPESARAALTCLLSLSTMSAGRVFGCAKAAQQGHFVARQEIPNGRQVGQ